MVQIPTVNLQNDLKAYMQMSLSYLRFTRGVNEHRFSTIISLFCKYVTGLGLVSLAGVGTRGREGPAGGAPELVAIVCSPLQMSRFVLLLLSESLPS